MMNEVVIVVVESGRGISCLKCILEFFVRKTSSLRFFFLWTILSFGIKKKIEGGDVCGKLIKLQEQETRNMCLYINRITYLINPGGKGNGWLNGVQRIAGSKKAQFPARGNPYKVLN